MRRATLRAALLLPLVTPAVAAEPDRAPPKMANGIKVAEVTANSATVWTRTTDGKAAGRPGEVRVAWWPVGDKSERRETPWRATDPEQDFTRRFALSGLSPETEYRLQVSALASTNEASSGSRLTGGFRTAPAADSPADVTFTVVTGQRNDTRDRGDQGHAIYQSMLELRPDFFVHTGDVVYYDKPGPQSRTPALARFRWNRMYAYPLQREFHNHVPSYFIKDDHDIVRNDCFPKQSYGELTWDEGVAIFREQTAAPPTPYRTVRWGRDLQVWMLEGREFRSPNNMPDGPDKTILGAEQIAWLESTIAASDAAFKVIISATPIVGPDRSNKQDNHANKGFQHEGDWLRAMLAKVPNLYVACGDRHWQYASVDPPTGLREFCSGPTTNAHAGGWSQKRYDPERHLFLRVKGGFLSVALEHKTGAPRLAFRHHRVDGAVVNEEVFELEPAAEPALP
ncbi:MAG: alkaline phosphatase D family protein [Planctomycetota bacterium]